jgi:hypothetical protein
VDELPGPYLLARGRGPNSAIVKRNGVLLLAGLVLLTGACGPAYMTLATRGQGAIHGPIAPVIDQMPGRDEGYTGAVGLGLGNRHLGMELAVHGLNVGKGTFAAPVDDAMGRWAVAQATAEARWTWLRWGRLGLQVRGGGNHTVIVDKMTGARSLGIGYTYGAGAELMFKSVTVWATASRTGVRFIDGPAQGDSQLRDLTVGISLWR